MRQNTSHFMAVQSQASAYVSLFYRCVCISPSAVHWKKAFNSCFSFEYLQDRWKGNGDANHQPVATPSHYAGPHSVSETLMKSISHLGFQTNVDTSTKYVPVSKQGILKLGVLLFIESLPPKLPPVMDLFMNWGPLLGTHTNCASPYNFWLLHWLNPQ